MELTYDPRHNVAHLRLHKRTAEVETVRVGDELNVDIAPDGTVYGIEFLNANDQLGGGDGGNLVVVNEALGERRELALGVGTKDSRAKGNGHARAGSL